MFRQHWVWQLFCLSANKCGGCCVQWPHGRGHGCCGSSHFVNLGRESYKFLWEVTVAIVAKNEYFEKQPVQCKLQMTEKIYLFWHLTIHVWMMHSHPSSSLQIKRVNINGSSFYNCVGKIIYYNWINLIPTMQWSNKKVLMMSWWKN